MSTGGIDKKYSIQDAGMKNKFSWYFKASENEVESIWRRGILTVDANVLLDLYRYHESTRNTLIDSLKQFNGRLWLTNQAAEEFFRNRTKVIVSSEKTFKQATDEVDKFKGNLESAVAHLKGNRIIPDEVADSLIEAINPAIHSALENIIDAKSSYPNYLQEDPILNELKEMFEDSVGEGFSESDLSTLKEEAVLRNKNNIPPGYMDGEKDGDRSYGDFILWREILLHAKNQQTPIIFVTSERKEDWWERISGKTIGPRPELLKEASECSGQRMLIYQTDRFLELASLYSGSELDSDAVDEIRAVDLLRSDGGRTVDLIEQKALGGTDVHQEGVLVLNLKRPVKNFNIKGYFDPYMKDAPEMSLTVAWAPEELGKFRLRANSSTNYEFNVQVMSREDRQLLPVGGYGLKYKATCDESRYVTINKFANMVGVPSERLLEQLNSAGVEVSNEFDEISDSQKLQLLQYLRNQNGHGK